MPDARQITQPLEPVPVLAVAGALPDRASHWWWCPADRLEPVPMLADALPDRASPWCG